MLALIIPLSELGGNIPGIGNQLPGGPPPHPGHGLPGGGQIDNTLPQPPIAHLPPQLGTLPIYPATPGHDLPPPGSVYPPLGPEVPKGKALAVIYISGVGSRWTVIDTSLSIGGGPAPTPPGHVSGGPVPPQVTPQVRY